MAAVQFRQNSDGNYGLFISIHRTEISQENPVEMEILHSDRSSTTYAAGYQSVSMPGESCLEAFCEIVTENGSRFEFRDTFHPKEQEIILSRSVLVTAEDGHDYGFTSSFGLHGASPEPLQNLEVFIPGIWYRHNEHVVSSAFGGFLHDTCYYMRITRMAMPFVALYDPVASSFYAIKHLSPAPSTGFRETTADWLVSDSFQYSSMGIRNQDYAEIRYLFPGSEGENNYIDSTRKWARRSHPVREGICQNYQLSVTAGLADDSYEALGRIWSFYYKESRPEHKSACSQQVYEDGISLLDTYMQEYNGVTGIPFWTTVPEGNVSDLSYQFGFVGQQAMCAYQLMRYGRIHHDQRMLGKAEKVIDFWVSHSAEDSILPQVWYNVFPDTFRDYPSYLRTLSDGMEGILASYIESLRNGTPRKEWLSFCIRIADWIVDNQNEDGSWFRAYNKEGQPVHHGKFNTTCPIRFLVNLYELTGKQDYCCAAVRAGDFALEHIVQPMAFAGGTADNDNTLDKEAGMMAVYAFHSLYQITGDSRYLEAAERAALYTATWTYVWNYQVKPFRGNYVFDKADMTGLSLIATGHSHADVMMGYMPFEYFWLWLETGKYFYLEFCRFLHGNTKQTTDWNRTYHYAYPGLVEESGELAMQYQNGLGKWLPWCTIAMIESLTRFEEKFGDMDIAAASDQKLEELRSDYLLLKSRERSEDNSGASRQSLLVQQVRTSWQGRI